MKPERWRLAIQDLRWRAGLLAFAVLAAVGGICAPWTLHELRIGGARAASEDTRALARSVAQTLAQQLARAARLGIPLEELPRVAPHLEAALAHQPALASLAIVLPDGRTLHAAGVRTTPGDAVDSVGVDIAIQGGSAGTVVAVAGSSASLSQSLVQARALGAVVVLGLALCAGLWVALGPGARLERQRRAIQTWLEEETVPSSASLDAQVGEQGGLRPLLDALIEGDAEQRAARDAVQAYAEELLAVDFDGTMREGIERIVGEEA